MDNKSSVDLRAYFLLSPQAFDRYLKMNIDNKSCMNLCYCACARENPNDLQPLFSIEFFDLLESGYAETIVFHRVSFPPLIFKIAPELQACLPDVFPTRRNIKKHK